ncbi:MAG: gliding motility protein GldL [Bacteroidota bacterium]|nr:gliding motility protein GldL [Bacteroidota bacterium]
MGLATLTKSKNYKAFMGKLYGIGASVVITGALFKITHQPGANLMLTVGLLTEAIIFFFSAFEQPYIEPDWTKVYPELAFDHKKGDEIPRVNKGTANELDAMLSKAKIGPDLIESLGEGIRSLSDNASKLSQIGNASVATSEFSQNIQTASLNVKTLSDSYRRNAESLNQDVEAKNEYLNNLKNASQSIASLTQVYNDTTATVKNDLSATETLTSAIKSVASSAVALSERYSQTAQLMARSVDQISQSSTTTNEYTNQVKLIAQNMQALNAVYEIQLRSVNDQVKHAENLKTSINQFIGTIDSSNAGLENYKREVDTLNANVRKLNNIYGNMITAMKS